MKSDSLSTLPPDMPAGKKEKPASGGILGCRFDVLSAGFRYLRLPAWLRPLQNGMTLCMPFFFFGLLLDISSSVAGALAFALAEAPL